jgi:molybdopterin molybdotransferase
MTFDELIALVDNNVRALSSELVPTIAAHDRVAARTVCARRDMPPYDVSALDGYAVKGEGCSFIVKGILEPFQPTSTELRDGEALFVPTGALLPAGTRFVARERVTERQDCIVTVADADEAKIVGKGSWQAKGAVLVRKGERLTGYSMAALSLAEQRAVRAYRRPKVAVINTGTELKKGRMIDSNRYLLTGLAERDGGDVVSSTTVEDREGKLVTLVKGLLDTAHLLILTGGTAKGKKDLTREALRRLHATFFLDAPPISPGKTMVFGKIRTCILFVLPGNPLVIGPLYELLVKRALYRIAGRQIQQEEHELQAPTDIEKPVDKIVAVPVRVNYQAMRIDATYVEGPNGFAVLEPGVERVRAGETVRVVRA